MIYGKCQTSLPMWRTSPQNVKYKFVARYGFNIIGTISPVILEVKKKKTKITQIH